MAAIDAIDAAGIRYCVLRNYEEIPIDPGRDIDLIVEDEDLNDIEMLLKPIAGRFDWRVLVRCRGHHEGTSYYFLDPSSDEVRQLELHFTRVRWARLPVLTSSQLLASRVQKESGIWVAADRHIAVQRLVQFGLAGGIGSMKPAYWAWLVEYGRTNGAMLTEALDEIGIPHGMSRSLVESVAASDPSELQRRIRGLRLRFVFTRLKREPAAMGQIARLVVGRIQPDRLDRCGVVVQGADDRLIAAIRPMFLDVATWDGSQRTRRAAIDTLARAGLVLLHSPASWGGLSKVTIDVDGLPPPVARRAVVDLFAANHDRI